jgi:hypothetical protein
MDLFNILYSKNYKMRKSPFHLQTKGEIDLCKLFVGSNLYLFSYARHAFRELLRVMAVGSGDIVYIPSFICRDMLSPINDCGAQVVFYEVDLKLRAKLKSSVKAKLVLAVNYFGFAQDLDPFYEYCKINGALLVEDNAHGLFSRDQKGKLLGSRGDFGLLSIRKTVFIPNGAALLVNGSEYKKGDVEQATFGYTNEDLSYKKKKQIKKLVNLLGLYFGVTILVLRRCLRYLKTGSSNLLPDRDSEYIMPQNTEVTSLIKEGLLPISINEENLFRRNSYLRISKWAKKLNISPIWDSLSDQTIPFVFPFYASEEESKKFESFLLRKGFFVLPWPDIPKAVADSCPIHYKQVKVVPFIW